MASLALPGASREAAGSLVFRRGRWQLIGSPTDFWGKLEMDLERRPTSWHPLLDHCADVAATCHALLTSTLIARRLARTAGVDSWTPTQLARLCTLAAWHDIGKFNRGFQAKSDPDARLRAGHVREVLCLFERACDESEQLGAALTIDTLGHWGQGELTIYQLLIAAICHHGRPLPIGGDMRVDLWRPVASTDPFAGVSRLRAATAAWFPEAFVPGGDPLPASTELQHAFSGLVMLADWIGSDRDAFPFRNLEDAADRFGFASERAAMVLSRMGMATARARGTPELLTYLPRILC